eukprot:6174881-Pleurochrysis_carterae.AAC.2
MCAVALTALQEAFVLSLVQFRQFVVDSELCSPALPLAQASGYSPSFTRMSFDSASLMCLLLAHEEAI